MNFNLISEIFSGFLGAIGGVWLSSYLIIKKEKRAAALDLHREWNSTEMTKHRRIAYELIKKYPVKSYDELVHLEKGEHGMDASISLYVIMRFFQRIYFSIKHRHVSEPLILDLFGDVYYDWYYQTFETGIVSLEWEISKNLRDLMKWYREINSFVQDDEWRRKYKKKRAMRLEELKK